MIRLKRVTPALGLAVLAAAGVASSQQEEPAAQFGERIQVTEVLLDVLVTDARGKVIIGLDKEDFIVEEGDQQIPLTAATFYGSTSILRSPALARRLGAAAGSMPVDRYFVLFFHDPRRLVPRLAGQQLEAARWAKRWVEQQLTEGDWVAVVSYDVKLKIHQDFTRDRERILAALTDAARGKNPDATWPTRLQLEPDSGPSLMRHLPQGRELRRQSKRIQDGLKLLAEAAGNTTGRKNLLFFSIGFGEVNQFGNWDPDIRYYPRMMQALNDNNVAVYTISLVENLIEEGPVISALGDSLSLLADDTGGQYFFNFVSFNRPLTRVAEENGGYYLLSYSAQYARGENGYREVKVRTTNPDFRVRARNGYLFGG